MALKYQLGILDRDLQEDFGSQINAALRDGKLELGTAFRFHTSNPGIHYVSETTYRADSVVEVALTFVPSEQEPPVFLAMEERLIRMTRGMPIPRVGEVIRLDRLYFWVKQVEYLWSGAVILHGNRKGTKW